MIKMQFLCYVDSPSAVLKEKFDTIFGTVVFVQVLRKKNLEESCPVSV